MLVCLCCVATLDICALPPSDVGPCKANKLRYTYDASLGRCTEFYYGGCRGNANRFLTLDICQDTCQSQQPGSSNILFSSFVVLSWISQLPQISQKMHLITCMHCDVTVTRVYAHTESSAAVTCSLAYDRGACDNYTIHWYYSSADRRCAQFYYGGCGGNANRFRSRDECYGFCVGTTTALPTTMTTAAGVPTDAAVAQTVEGRASGWPRSDQHCGYRHRRGSDRNRQYFRTIRAAAEQSRRA